MYASTGTYALSQSPTLSVTMQLSFKISFFTLVFPSASANLSTCPSSGNRPASGMYSQKDNCSNLNSRPTVADNASISTPTAFNDKCNRESAKRKPKWPTPNGLSLSLWGNHKGSVCVY